MNTIGTKIAKLRSVKGLSQTDLAIELNTTQSNICKIESGLTEKIDFIFMQKVCDFFEVDFNYFLEPTIQNNVKVNKKGAVGNYNNITINNQKKDTTSPKAEDTH